MQNELIERYIYAVTKRLPYKIRADIEKELRALIDDMLEQRCGDVLPGEHDIRVVLTEIGTPAELAEKYDPDKHSALIGQPYYRKYKFILKIVLAAAGGGMLLSGAITTILGGGMGHPFFRLVSWIGMTFMGLIYAFAFVTALFAFFERRGVKIDMDNGLNDLPPVPKKSERIDRHEPITGIVLSTLFLVVILLGAPYFIGMFNGTDFIPLFNQEVLQQQWMLIAGIFALGVLKEVLRLNEGRYTFRLAVASLLLNTCTLVLMILFISTPGLFNPAFTAALYDMFGEGGSFIANMFSQFPRFFLGIVAFAVVLDSVMSFVRIGKSAKA